MKILIDTNIYLDFYRSSKDALKLLPEIFKHSDNIILTDQIIQEFERNKEIVIKGLKKNFESESNLENYSSSYLQNLEAFSDLVLLQKQYQTKRKEVISAIDQLLQYPEKDPIATFFNDLVKAIQEKTALLLTTDEIIQKAHRRKLIGNPPLSSGYSIGDEINWEIVVNNVKDDIIIVGRDNTYTKNFSFLQRDFYSHTGRYITRLSDSITEALSEMGVSTDDYLKDIEQKMIQEVAHYNDFWKQKRFNKTEEST